MRTVTLLVDDSVTDAQLRERLNGLEVEWKAERADAEHDPNAFWSSLSPAEQARTLESIRQAKAGELVDWEDVKQELDRIVS
jgi:hypothetical protein